MVLVAPVFLHELPVDFNKGDNGALVVFFEFEFAVGQQFSHFQGAVLQTRIIVAVVPMRLESSLVSQFFT